MTTPKTLDEKHRTLGWVEVVKEEESLFFLVDDGDDDDMEILAMWERGEHTCEKYDTYCAVCDCEQEEGDIRLLTELLEDEEEDYEGEIRVLTEDEIQRVVSEIVDE